MANSETSISAIANRKKKFRKAKKWLAANRRKIRKIKNSRKLNAQKKARRILIILASTARRMKQRQEHRRAFNALVLKDKRTVRRGASTHLPLIRFFVATHSSASALRYADGIDTCLRQTTMSWKKMKAFVRENGISALSRAHRDVA